MNGTVLLFQDLGDNVRAQELMNYYIEQRSNEPELFDLDNRDIFMFEQPLPEVAAAFQQKHQFLTRSNPITIADIITGIVEGKLRPEKHLEALINATEDDYYNFYKSLRGKNIRAYLNATLVNQGYDDGRKVIGDKAEAAIKRLANESLINRRRLRGFINYTPANSPIVGVLNESG